MANLNISEFRATSNNGQSGIGPVLPATASQNVSFPLRLRQVLARF